MRKEKKKWVKKRRKSVWEKKEREKKCMWEKMLRNILVQESKGNGKEKGKERGSI